MYTYFGERVSSGFGPNGYVITLIFIYFRFGAISKFSLNTLGFGLKTASSKLLELQILKKIALAQAKCSFSLPPAAANVLMFEVISELIEI